MVNKRITFLLGAGAAVPWGGPLTNDLTELIIENCTLKTKSGKNVVNYLFEILDKYYDYSSSINFETIVSLIELLLEYYHINSTKGISPDTHPVWPKLFTVQKEFEDELFSHYELIKINSGIDGDGVMVDIKGEEGIVNNLPVAKSRWKFAVLLRIYMQLKEAITDKIFLGYDNKDSIVNNTHSELLRSFIDFLNKKNNNARFYTTNYDNLLPEIFKKKQIFNGFETNGVDKVINKEKISENTDELCYYNLHGSIYWDTFFCFNSNREEFKFVSSPPYFPYGPQNKIVDTGKEVVFSNILIGYNKTQKVSIEPLNYFELAFSEDCRRSDIICVIGSGLGDYDIRKAIKNSLIDEKKVLIIITKGDYKDLEKYEVLIENISTAQDRSDFNQNDISGPWLTNRKRNCYLYLSGFDKFLETSAWKGLKLLGLMKVENIPKPFCLNKKTFKVFVLGADPTNFTDNGKPKMLEYAFGILSDEPRYFDQTLKNLRQVGLHLEDIYVQNVIQEYLEDKTSKNKDWEVHAQKWLPKLKKELDSISKAKRKPILVTAERIMKFLVNDDFILPSAKKIYADDQEDLFIIKPKDNKLSRPLIAFYRYSMYGIERNDKYREFLINMFAE